MNELLVTVKQEVGTIQWNFQELKSALEVEMERYSGMVYTDDTIGDAKSDRATLNKLKESVEERRKDIKKKCLEPYSVIESQAKELIELIEKPIGTIDQKVKEYEKRRKEAARTVIISYWNLKADVLPEDIRDKARAKIYDSRWENASATKKSWTEGIEKGIQSILDEIESIRSFKSEFEEDALAVYKVSLSLSDAIKKMNELNAQKERILEQERKRQEAEQRRKEEQEKKRLEAEKEKEAAPHSCADTGGIAPATPYYQEPTPSRPAPKREPYAEQNREAKPEAPADNAQGGKTIRITGTPEQVDKILNYIKFIGADYLEV